MTVLSDRRCGIPHRKFTILLVALLLVSTLVIDNVEGRSLRSLGRKR